MWHIFMGKYPQQLAEEVYIYKHIFIYIIYVYMYNAFTFVGKTSQELFI